MRLITSWSIAMPRSTYIILATISGGRDGGPVAIVGATAVKEADINYPFLAWRVTDALARGHI